MFQQHVRNIVAKQCFRSRRTVANEQSLLVKMLLC